MEHRIKTKQSDKNKVSLENEIEFKKLVELLPEIVARIDKELNIIFLNKYGLKATGYTKDDLRKGLNVFKVIKEEDKSEARKNIKKILKKQKIGPNEYTIVKKDGSNFQVLANSNVIEDDNGTFLGLRIVAIDLTEEKKAEEKIKESEQRYQFLAENVNDIIFVQDMNLNIKYASSSATKFFGYKTKDINRIKMKDIMVKDSYKKAIGSFKKYVDLAKKDINFNIPLMEYEYIRKDGSTFWGELKVGFLRNLEGNLTGCLGVLRDVTERKKTEEKLKYISFHDSLTGLYNRAYFEEELKRLDTKRQLPLSIIVGDVNGLKLVNDAFGHLKGDLYLCEAARILEESCRKEDIIARWGGDEFSIILPKTKNDHAYKIIKRIRSAANKIKENGIPLSMSLGVSTKERPQQDIKTVIQVAEYNMYSRKLVERKSITSSIISALERTLWEKSHETREHAKRIKKLAVKLGNSINLYQNKLDELILLSALHDIGKIAISDDILNKNDKLTEKEWRRIKKHPEIGYNICESSPQLVAIAEAVLAHHEWWNGSGYPLGLKGKNIPITSRIIAIADSYDVMITGRNYKEPLSKNEAIKELKKYSGIQFDPKLVKNFVKILKENKET
ncbi:MAG: PAS domain S-box protein [Actinobacteria bacterium]|nr:PAS domain S-box protein [Actinomycetota bacterium]MBL7123737.1 PAS domain S-box protein [Actinomycetota bacterium]